MALDQFRTFMEIIAHLLEVMGVFAILIGVIFGLLEGARNLIRNDPDLSVFDLFRARLARSILIGVEFLIAADIVGTVIVEPSLDNLGGLVLIVLIRAFLSFTLEVEIEGRWPWQRDRNRHDK